MLFPNSGSAEPLNSKKNNPQLVLVQGQDFIMNEVNLHSLSCSCTDFKKMGKCVHLDLATDIYLFKGRKYRFLIYSAYHKEVRKNCIHLGTQWAEIIQLISGEKGLIKYCLKIVFEETRNIGLYYNLISQSKSGMKLAQDLILSFKKYELKCLPNHMSHWINGYERFLINPELTQKDFKTLSTPEDIYRAWFYFKTHKEYREELKQLLQKEHGNNKSLLAFLNQSGKSGYEFMVALESSVGLLDFNEINQLRENSKIIESRFIPRFERYIHDPHTFEGKRLMKMNIGKFINDADLEETGLDLRYSGLISSSYKRELAFEHGLEEWKWDQVKIEKAKIKGVMALESFFYPSLFLSSKKN